MHKPLYCVREIEKVSTLVHTLRYTRHNGFPVVAASSPCRCSLPFTSDADCPVHLDIRKNIPNQVAGGIESLGAVPYASSISRPGSSLLSRPPSGYNLLTNEDTGPEFFESRVVGGPSTAPSPMPATAEEEGDLARPATPSRSTFKRRSRSTGFFCSGCMQQAAEGSGEACAIHSPPAAGADDGAGVLTGLVLRSQLLLAIKNGAFCDEHGRPLNDIARSTDTAFTVGPHPLTMQLFLDAYPRAPNLEVRRIKLNIRIYDTGVMISETWQFISGAQCTMHMFTYRRSDTGSCLSTLCSFALYA